MKSLDMAYWLLIDNLLIICWLPFNILHQVIYCTSDTNFLPSCTDTFVCAWILLFPLVVYFGKSGCACWFLPKEPKDGPEAISLFDASAVYSPLPSFCTWSRYCTFSLFFWLPIITHCLVSCFCFYFLLPEVELGVVFCPLGSLDCIVSMLVTFPTLVGLLHIST